MGTQMTMLDVRTATWTPEKQHAAQAASRKAVALLADWAHCELTQDASTVRPSLLLVQQLLTQALELHMAGDPGGFHTSWLRNTLTQLQQLHQLKPDSRTRTLRGWRNFRKGAR